MEPENFFGVCTGWTTTLKWMGRHHGGLGDGAEWVCVARARRDRQPDEEREDEREDERAPRAQTKTFHIHFDFSILSSTHDAVRGRLPGGHAAAAGETKKSRRETKGEFFYLVTHSWNTERRCCCQPTTTDGLLTRAFSRHNFTGRKWNSLLEWIEVKVPHLVHICVALVIGCFASGPDR